jgi:CubicO group peptidase (beta-lactamase class C family)
MAWRLQPTSPTRRLGQSNADRIFTKIQPGNCNLDWYQLRELYTLGSVTKTLLAAGILRLASEGKINLDYSAEKYLVEISFDNKWSQTNPVTVRHLLDHTSGLEDLRLWQMFTAKAAPTSPLLFAFEKDPFVLEVRTRPRSVFSYSNMGYTLLGIIIEKVTNEPYETYLDKNLLQPLGMLDSTFGFVSQTGEKPDSRLAMGHLECQTIFPALPIYLRPAAQFTTTAYDMGLFLKFLMSDGTLNGLPFHFYRFVRESLKFRLILS